MGSDTAYRRRDAALLFPHDKQLFSQLRCRGHGIRRARERRLLRKPQHRGADGPHIPYILSSGTLSDVIAADLHTKGVPGTISASCIKGTNLLTVTVRGSDPQTAYKVLQSVLKNYPDVAQYVVGQTRLTVIEDGGIPRDTGRTAVVRGSILKGALIGLAAGIALVILRAIMFRTIRSEGELRSLLNVPYLGTLPVCQKKKRRNSTRGDINILFDAHREDYIEAMRLVRTRIDRQLDGKKVLMVTSSVAGEGKSTVAANLAISMALKGRNVILVDCDLRNPSVGRMFNITDSHPGLAAVLDGKVSLDEALVEVTNDGVPMGLYLLPGAEKQTRRVEVLGTDAMRRLVDGLRSRADMVILDTPPSAVLVDAMMLVRHVDGVAYVIMSDYARRRYIVDGVQELINGGAKVTGCILNGGHGSSGRYGYYGSYGSYGRYGYGRYGYGRYGYYGSYGSEENSSEEE